MDELIGQSLGRYRIDSLLGQGGMGAVYRATDVTLKRTVAVKVMHAQFARQGDFQMRFLDEARTSAQLDHPGIVKVLDFGEAQSLLYIVMEFLPGDNLRKMLQKLKEAGQWIVLPEAIQLVRQVCLSVDYAHRHSVLHRDIKPDNIMLKPEPVEGLPYRPILTDLGLARLASSAHLSLPGVSMGTPAYMSPEQASGTETDARSDVYSLGIMLYELAVGHLPFPIKTLTEAIRCHTKEPPPPPRTQRPDLPPSLEQVILHALEKAPSARFDTAARFAEALGNLLPGLGKTAPQSTIGNQATANVSLVTMGATSMSGGRGPSILGSFPDPGSLIRQDRISVLAPDHSIRSVLMKPGGLTIGRDQDNDVILDDKKVSKHHLRITYDGTKYSVTDLKSTNGSYLANYKLLPDIAQEWTPDKVLRIGDHYMRLECRQEAVGGTMPAGTRASGTRAVSSAHQGPVGVFMETTAFTVTPGGRSVIPFTIVNQGEVVDHFGVSVAGVPAEWLAEPIPLIYLLPGLQQAVAVCLQPPRAPTSRSGTYALTIRVAGQSAPEAAAEMKANLAVEPFHQLNGSLDPQKIQAGKTAKVKLRNLGNTPEPVTLTWRDQADELTFTPPRSQVTVPEGKEADVAFRAVTRQRRLIGGEKQHAFAVQVSGPDGEGQSYAGQAVSRAVLPPWAIPAAFFILLALCGCLGWVFFTMIAKPPVIQTLAYDPPSPISGQPVTVRWHVDNAQNVELRPLLTNLPSEGSYVFQDGIPGNANVSLYASNLFGPAEKNLLVAAMTPTPSPTVAPTPTTPIGAPLIEIWKLSATEAVDGDTITIQWKVSNADSVVLQPFGNVDAAGQMQDKVRQTKTYTLIATNKTASVQRSQEVFVKTPTPTLNAGATQIAAATGTAVAKTVAAQQTIDACPGPPIIGSFSANPASLQVAANQTAQTTLSWSGMQNANSFVIDNGIGQVAASGSTTVAVGNTITFTLTATGCKGTATRQVTVLVAPPLTFDFTPKSVSTGSWVTITLSAGVPSPTIRLGNLSLVKNLVTGDNKTWKVLIPSTASTDYLYVDYGGQTVKSTQQLTIGKFFIPDFDLFQPIFPLLPSGDVIIQDVFLSTDNRVIARIAVDPTGSLTGNYTWKVFSNNAQVWSGTLALPTGSQAFWSDYKVSGTQTIKVTLEINDKNNNNNQMTKTCYAASHSCQ